jgi:Plasmid pRiA4b ORF-3-like protein.
MSKIYQFRIELEGIEPTIWRSVQLNDDTQLLDLHYAVQIAMGWYDSHLYQFELNGKHYGDPEALEDETTIDDSMVDILEIFKNEKDSIRYTYDFGDDWKHTITLEKIIDVKKPLEHMLCVGGKRNCPPEDCGGIPGYLEILETLKNPDTPEYEELTNWLGEVFDPEFFDMQIINECFRETEEQFMMDDEMDWDVSEKN